MQHFLYVTDFENIKHGITMYHCAYYCVLFIRNMFNIQEEMLFVFT